MDEYEHAMSLRQLWTGSINTWGQVFISLGAAIFAFFVYLTAKDGLNGNDFGVLLLGWFIFAICMFYWRWIVNHIDRQIVELYHIFIKLEREKGWDINTRYFYNNLSDKSKKRLIHDLGLESLPIIFDDFADEVIKLNKVRKVSDKGIDQYSVLLDCWRRYGANAVHDRGHKIQDIVVSIIIALLFGLVLSLVIGALAWLFSVILLLLLWYWEIKIFGWRLI